MNQRSFTRLTNLLGLSKSNRANRLRQRKNRKLLLESLERREVFANFSPGNLAIVRIDNGGTPLSNASTAAFIDEYTPTGTLVQSIALPTAASGSNNPLTISGTSTSDGSLNRSSDGNFLVVTGYGTAPGTTGVTGTTSAAVPRVIGRIAVDGTVDTTTALNTFSGNNFRGATSVDGNNFWAVGGNSGVQYAALGATGASFTNISNAPTNIRTISIFDGNLYANSGSGAFRLTQVGTGLPTTAGQVTANIPGSPTTGSPYGFFYADLDAGVAGVDTLYVADDTTNSTTAGGVSKYSLVGGTWVSNGVIAAGLTASPSLVSGVRGLTGSVSGTTVTLFGTSNGTAGSITDTLFSIVDASGYNAALAATPTLITTLASANALFRGVSFTPSGGTDTTPPTVTSIDDNDGDNSVLVGAPMNYTVSFNEDIDGTSVTAADFDNSGTATITIGTITETSPGVFSVQVTPTSVGSLVLRIPNGAVIQDVAGNSLVVPVSDNDTVDVTAADNTPPTVISIEDGDADNIVLTNAVVNYTITFSEDIDAATVTASDFVNSGTSAITIGTIVETTPGVFTVPVTPTTAGTLILQIPTGAVIKDVAGNDLVAPVTDNDTLTVNVPDLTPPTLVSIADNVSGGPVLQGQQITYTVTFSEDINAATVSAADFDNAGSSTITVGTIAEPTPGVFTINVLATSAGTVKLRIPNGAVISDTSSNNLVAPVEDDTTINVNLSALTVGTIAFTAYQSDNTGGAGGDFFEFVAISPIAAGQAIYFTDSAYQTTPGAFRTNENLLRWVAQSNIAAGAKVSFTSTGGTGVPNTAEWTGINPVTGAFLTSATAAAIGLAGGGDQVAAFVDPIFGGTDLLNGTAVAAINFGASTYPATLAGNTDNSLTALPPGLTDGTTAVSVGDFANGRYDPNVAGSIESGTASDVRTSVNTDTNWENAATGTVFGTGGTVATFTIGGSNSNPVVAANSAAVSGNEGTTITNTGTWSDPDASNVVTLTASVGTIVKNANGTWDWSLASTDQVAATTVTITANDGVGGTATTTFTFTVNNVAPALTRTNASVTGNVGTSLTNTGTYADVPADTVTLTASLGTIVNNGNGTWSWSFTPTTAVSSQVVTITGSDEDGGSSTVTFTFTANSTIATRATRYIGATGTSALASLATDKVALLPGQASTFANYTNYSRGLNGVVVDVTGLPASTTNAQMLASLQFASWNGIAAGGFVALPGTVVPTVSIAAGAGAGGSARVTITFADNAVQNTWLQVTVVSNANTGLAANDVFYFGNVLGELDFGNTATRLRVNGQDAALILANQSPGANSAPVTNKFDLNRDGRVNGQDYAFILANQQAAGIVAPITATSARAGSAARSSSSAIGGGSAAPIDNPVSSSKSTSGVVSGSGVQILNTPATGSVVTTGNSAVASGQSNKIDLSASSDGSSAKTTEKGDSKLESIDSFFASLWANA